MKKFVFVLILTLSLNLSVVKAKDIEPIKHNEFGEAVLAIDIDSVKPYSQSTYSVEILSLQSENWSLKDQIPIFKYEIDVNNRQYRIIEYFSRYKKNWKIAQIGQSNSQLLENNELKWLEIDKGTPIDIIYMITSIVGQNGKKYYKENILAN